MTEIQQEWNGWLEHFWTTVAIDQSQWWSHQTSKQHTHTFVYLSLVGTMMEEISMMMRQMKSGRTTPVSTDRPVDRMSDWMSDWMSDRLSDRRPTWQHTSWMSEVRHKSKCKDGRGSVENDLGVGRSSGELTGKKDRWWRCEEDKMWGSEIVGPGACGAMDNAPDYGSGDSRFESWQARLHFSTSRVANTLSSHNHLPHSPLHLTSTSPTS